MSEDIELKSLNPIEEPIQELPRESSELSHRDYVKYLVNTQSRAMVPKRYSGRTYKRKKLKTRITGPYKWMYRQYSHSQDDDENFDFWKVNLPRRWQNTKSEDFYNTVQKLKDDEDKGNVTDENFKDLKDINDFISHLEETSPSARGGKSRKNIRKKRRGTKHVRTKRKRNTFLN